MVDGMWLLAHIEVLVAHDRIAIGNPEKNKRMGYSTVYISQPRSPNMSRSKELIRDKSEVGMSMYECAEVSHHML